uniref:Uncharacterized protein n=1 Tax=Anopheles christyi TaxID=43041 RepID=A0A182KF01_9DIPT
MSEYTLERLPIGARIVRRNLPEKNV